MKPAQWIAVLVLALMVGGITFVSVYLGGSNRDGSDSLPTEAPPSINFPIKAFPQEGEPPLVTEVRQAGHQDFWFTNESEQDLAVGLNEKGCTCSEVEIAVAPPSWISHSLHQMAVAQAIQMQLHGLYGLTMLAALNRRDPLFPELRDNDARYAMLTKENSFTVPAGGIGRVRLSWQQQMARKLNTFADLWIGQSGGVVNARLDAHVLVVDPVVLAMKELTLPAVTTRELEKMEKQKTGQRAWIICGSMTRTHFRVQAELVHENIKPESDPMEVGEPIPLNSADIRKLIEEFGDKMPTILSGYKIPVTLKARAKDGTPAEWGHFTRLVRMTAEEDSNPVTLPVTGQVLGDVTVGEVGKLRGALDLGPFPRDRGTHASIILQTDEKNLDLELDSSRLPDFFKASLSKPEETITGHRLWKLRVEVPPGKARGEFPNANDPVYRDSAVYVKTKGKPPHSIRVPIMGTANR
jgi:hypothetical protein